jgi:hypothetical protein
MFAKIFETAPQRTLGRVLQSCDYVFVFHSGSEKLCAQRLHFGEQPFAGFIDEGDLSQIDDRTRTRPPFPRLSPTRAQFVNPRARQTAAQAPTLSVGNFGARNPKHRMHLIELWEAHGCSQMLPAHSEEVTL